MELTVPKPRFRWLLLAGLTGCAAAAGLEIQAFFAAQQSWDRLLSAIGMLTVALWVILLSLGLAVLLLSWFAPAVLRRWAWLPQRLGRFRWAVIAAAILSVAWFYLYSPWQAAWPGPWTQLALALGLSGLVAWIAQPSRPAWKDGSELALVLGVFLYPRIVLELRAGYSSAVIYRGATVLGYLALLFFATLLFTPAGPAVARRMIQVRSRLGWARWLLALLFLSGPLIYLAAAGPEFFIVNPAIRFLLLLVEIAGLAYSIGTDGSDLLPLKGMIVSTLALTAVSFVTRSLLLVVNYPFSLSWSEGNRFYDYSMIFGQKLYAYSGTISNPYVSGAPGRYVLWGVLFLWRGLSIVMLRFWNVMLYTIPPLVVGVLLARKLKDPFLRAGVVLFVGALFIVESPLHPPFLLAAALAVLFMYDSSVWHRGIALAAASLYAGASRWTWIPAAAAWGVLVDLLLYYPSRKGSLFQRLTPTLILAAVGLLPGLVSGFHSLPTSSSAREYHQPLLWYRLLPNPTFPLGVLFSTILITGPALCILAWWVLSRRWKLDWVQQLGVAGALLGFLGAGLVVSMKIGGGADLHNLDMYLMTLTLVMALGVFSISQAGRLELHSWPGWSHLLLTTMILFPLYGFTPFAADAGTSSRLELVKPQEVTQTLNAIQIETDRAGQQGQILFMDQRQLLTFGYIHGVQFVPDYEKKYMMDNAMAGAVDYFQGYYKDLAAGRFSLIVTEILHTRQERTGDFSEENNAWVTWVSEPTLCFYEPILVNKDVNLELLVPRTTPQPAGCETHLPGGE